MTKPPPTPKNPVRKPTASPAMMILSAALERTAWSPPLPRGGPIGLLSGDECRLLRVSAADVDPALTPVATGSGRAGTRGRARVRRSMPPAATPVSTAKASSSAVGLAGRGGGRPEERGPAHGPDTRAQAA